MKEPLKGREGEERLGRGQGFAEQQIAGGKIGDRQRVAVAAVGEHELALDAPSGAATPPGLRRR